MTRALASAALWLMGVESLLFFIPAAHAADDPPVYTVVNTWGGDPNWHPGGTWTLGDTGGQRIIGLEIHSPDDGETLTGKATYAEGTITVRGRSLGGNRYDMEWGSKAVWHPLGTWVIGGRAGQPVLALDITSKDEGKTLEGSMRYRNEGDISFRATLAEPQPEPPPAADAPDTE